MTLVFCLEEIDNSFKQILYLMPRLTSLKLYTNIHLNLLILKYTCLLFLVLFVKTYDICDSHIS